ncbi:MAG: hypothetical protein SNG35_06100 [Rikenellaceae bacterium]
MRVLFLILVPLLAPFLLAAQPLSSSLVEEVGSSIVKGYDGSVVTNVSLEEQMIKVRFLHKGIYKEAIFSPHGVWQRTLYNATLPDLTDEAKGLLAEEEYSDYDISQIEVIEQPQIKMYRVEMVNYIDSHPISVIVTDSGILL